jgi:hypothetical protein
MKPEDLKYFVAESNRIEGITRKPTDEELLAHKAFLGLPEVGVADLGVLVRELAPHAKLRSLHGLDVRVGNHYPPRGGPEILERLSRLLIQVGSGSSTPWRIHIDYETLHPFTDGNGRSGRALWAWQMHNARNERFMTMGFLHLFYYQTLDTIGR